ncbi:hypothetical protein [Aquimarina algiphila]|uniref:Uncharacterized protein n=1 Tax=Aquimarina algiphila TaxID=2047982 RepID=A0A554VAC2_9FLAO|nr:hypothetical protein [Aquimarina algiphila]TSE03013.1 hypothetical protein FOF46_30205 [Aquimarina algiphila]
MSKNVKIFLLKGISIDFENDVKEYNRLHSVIGYFTNLKELHGQFEKGSIQSYSTICSHMKMKGFYKTKNSVIKFKRVVHKFNEITITQVETNKLYQKGDYIDLSEILKKEASVINTNKAFLNF